MCNDAKLAAAAPSVVVVVVHVLDTNIYFITASSAVDPKTILVG